MSFLFTCPHCQTKTQVDDRYSGQSGECVACGRPIQLPHFASTPIGSDTQRPAPRGKSLPVGWIVAAAVVLVLASCLLYAGIRVGGRAMTRMQSTRTRTASIRNLEKIASALNAYAADHGTYPPPATMDSSGGVLHSWRVLILPYLGEEDLYDQFNLQKSWDEASNLMVATNEMPSVYRHPDFSSGLYSQTSYFLITGNQTLFPAAGPLGPGDLQDDASKTILVTEANLGPSNTLWTEPIDLEFALMRGQINGGNSELGGVLDEGVAVATVDGRGNYLPESAAPGTVRALVTPAGNEPLPDDVFD